MAITIEDGSGVADAVSYVTVVEARAYANARGLSLPADDLALEKLLVQSCDYLDTLNYKGERVASSQALAWPRKDVYIFDDLEPLPQNQIPSQLKKAQCQLSVDANVRGGDLLPTGDGREVKKTKVDVLEKEYFQGGSNSVLPVFNKALAILEPLLEQGGGFEAETVRG